jgi:predicted DNA-binding transcriptional regulator AlpA
MAVERRSHPSDTEETVAHECLSSRTGGHGFQFLAVWEGGLELPEVDTSLAAKRATKQRRESLLKRRHYRERKEQRLEALNHPEKANLKPAAVSIAEFAVLSGLSPATINRRIADGTIPSTKYLGRRLIAYSEVERLREGAETKWPAK